ncbi:MAG: tryptophan-rich sensory protein [Oscillospiraceae bacterium]|nr:tryptophan-rich sensory protein [Oscillospiraceae bacterium]
MKTRSWKTYAAWILGTEAVGGLAGLLIRNGVKYYEANAVKPALTPPSIVFPIAWGILYALMGIGAARIDLTPPSPGRRRSLRLYLLQLAFNFFWSILFFALRAYGISFLWIAALWVLIVRMCLSFWDQDKAAAWLQLPYLLWVLFAAYLNLGVWKLN